jgi:pantetheine-phosphate adenylyltransferase
LTVALYPGSFDPFTNAHLGIALRTLKVFDRLVIAVAGNSRKQTLFRVQEREAMIREVFADDARVEICSFEGLTVNYAAKIGASAIIRGLRAVADFEYEMQMANMNRKLNDKIETLFIMTAEQYFFVSSRNVKEVAALGCDVSGLVPKTVVEKLTAKFTSSVKVQKS